MSVNSLVRLVHCPLDSATEPAGEGDGTVVAGGRSTVNNCYVTSLAERPALITQTQHDKWMSGVTAVKSVIPRRPSASEIFFRRRFFVYKGGL